MTQVKKKETKDKLPSQRIEPVSSDWKTFSAPRTKPLLGTKVYLPILPYVLPVIITKNRETNLFPK